MITIDTETHQVSIPEDDAIFGVYGDVKSKVKKFRIPRFDIDGNDFADCNIRVIYTANEESYMHVIDGSVITDAYIYFEWIIDGVIQREGDVAFQVEFIRSDNDGDIVYSWHTRQANLTPYDGIDTPAIPYTQLVKDSVESLIKKLTTQASSEIDKIVEKAEETKEGIPEDYSEMDSLVKSLSRSILEIMPIVNTINNTPYAFPEGLIWGTTAEGAGWISKPEAGDISREEFDALKAAFEENQRMDDILWDLTRGPAWDYRNEVSTDMVVTAPSGARLASVSELGCKSFVLNQLVPLTPYSNDSGITKNGDGSLTINGTVKTEYYVLNDAVTCITGHKYYLYLNDTSIPNAEMNFGSGNCPTETKAIFMATFEKKPQIWFKNRSYVYDNVTIRPMIIDLTPIEQSLGVTFNTPEQFEEIFSGYYSYSMNEIVDVYITNIIAECDIVGHTETRKDISDLVSTYFQNGMKSTKSANDYFDFESGTAVSCVKEVALSDYSWTRLSENSWITTKEIPEMVSVESQGYEKAICSHYEPGETFLSNKNDYHQFTLRDRKIIVNDMNYADAIALRQSFLERNVILYFELEEPVEAPLTEEECKFLSNIDMSAGGTVTYSNESNDIHLPIHTKTKYAVKLREAVS